MFKFNFAEGEEMKDKCDGTTKLSFDWKPASKVEVPLSQYECQYESDDYVESEVFPGYELKLMRSDKVLQHLKMDGCQNIIEAESQHSDLIPAKYEGGLKIWECTYDLGTFMLGENIDMKNKFVLDLGCGAGVIGVIALLRGASVHFQDYNEEVIRSVTIPNVLLNFEDRQSALKRCEFYSGDWESFTTLSSLNNEKYDLICTSETIYNPENHKKLYEVFKQRLKENGIGLIAGKTYYFGVGGGMRQFEDLIKSDGIFTTDVAWKSEQGLQREILRLTRQQRQH